MLFLSFFLTWRQGELTDRLGELAYMPPQEINFALFKDHSLDDLFLLYLAPLQLFFAPRKIGL